MYYHRLNGKSECAKPSSYTCEDGVCTSFMQTGAQEVDNSTTDGGPQWCQSEEQSTLTLSAANKKLTLRWVIVDLRPSTCLSYLSIDM